MQELILLYHDEADECFHGALLIFFSNRDLWRKARMGRNYFKQFGTTSLQRLRKKPSSSWKGHLTSDATLVTGYVSGGVCTSLVISERKS